MSASQSVQWSFALNCIRGRSVSKICAFRFASVSKQLICRDLTFFSNRIAKKFKSNLKSNRDLFNGIVIVQIESPNVHKSRFKSQSRLKCAHYCLGSVCATAGHGRIEIASRISWLGWIQRRSKGILTFLLLAVFWASQKYRQKSVCTPVLWIKKYRNMIM